MYGVHNLSEKRISADSMLSYTVLHFPPSVADDDDDNNYDDAVDIGVIIGGSIKNLIQ